MFFMKNRMGLMGDQKGGYCRIHNQRIVQLGHCLSCSTIASICQSKGCIKHHQQNERIHNVFTIEYVRHVVKQFVNSDQSKKTSLKNMIADYFAAAKKQLQVLYEEIYEAVDHFKFDNLIFNNEENIVIEKLVNEDFNSVTCSQIAVIIPKLIKFATFEDGHFSQLREYLKNEKEKIQTVMDGIILNLPYFRDSASKAKSKQYVEIASQFLRQVNQKMKQITLRPKKLRIKYIEDQGQEQQSNLLSIQKNNSSEICAPLKKLVASKSLRFIVCNFVDIFRWNVRDQDFQVAFFEALNRYPFLRSVTIYTGYKVTDADYINEIISEGKCNVRIYKKEWTF